MLENLDLIRPVRKQGSERFHSAGRDVGIDVLAFWQWSGSDLLSNALRGKLGEFLVACDLGVSDGIRNEWDSFDLRTKAGARVEVKTSAYLQSWHQERLSKVSFGIAPTYAWEGSTNRFSTERKRHADVYVFCLLAHKDKKTVEPLNVSQWEFFVLPTRLLNEAFGSQKTITLSSLKKLNPIQVEFGSILSAVDSAFEISEICHSLPICSDL